MANIENHELLRGAISIYKRDSEGGKYTSENWYAAIKLPGKKAIRRSLKTTSKSEAIDKAQSLHYDLSQRSKRGLSLSPKSFEFVAMRYLEYFRKQVKIWESLDTDGKSNMEGISSNRLRNFEPILKKYLVPFFSGKYIQEFTDRDIDDYKSHRLGYWTSEDQQKIKLVTYLRNGKKVTRPKRKAEKSVPSYSTINKELTALRKIIEFAKQEKLISASEVPNIRRMKKPAGYDQKNERPSFTQDEIKKLLGCIRHMIANQPNPKHYLAHYRLYLYIQLMCYSGMRVTEAKNLRFSDTRLRNEGEESEHFTMWVKGKGKGRNLVPFKDCEWLIDRFRAMAIGQATQNGWVYSENMRVLSNEYGQPINSFNTALTNLLEKCDLLYAKNGRRRSAGSFRSFYITSALASGLMTHIQLAVNCGTSVSVIEKFYNRMDPSNFPEKFQFVESATISFRDHFGTGIANEHFDTDLGHLLIRSTTMK